MNPSTTIFEAAADNDVTTVSYLLRGGASVTDSARRYGTALHHAAANNAHEAARLLVEEGAEVDAIDSYGNTPLWKAIFAYDGDGQTIQLLLEAGSNPLICNNAGKTPFDLAYIIASTDVRKYFPASGPGTS